MPGGYLGPGDVVTWAGTGLATVLAVMAAVGATAQLRGWHRAGIVTPLVAAVNLGGFLPALGSDPVIAGAVVLWSLGLVSGHVLPRRDMTQWLPEQARQERDALRRFLDSTGAAARHLTLVALLATIAVAGYGIGERLPALVVTLMLNLAAVVVTLRLQWLLLRTSARAPLLAIVLLAGSGAALGRPGLALGLLAGYQAMTLAILVARTEVFGELLDHFLGAPALLVLVSFVVLIAIGTLLLTFPAASGRAAPMAPVDALFTATSASCVTGLIVLDTPHDLSLFGQVVVLVLIQAGGLSIMVLSTFAAILLGRGIGLRGEQALGEILDVQSVRSAYRLIVLVVLVTATVEVCGALLLTVGLVRRGAGWLEAAWYGVFHAVSAFCNAGFALQSDSLEGFADSPLVLGTVAVLIVLGGLGFAVVAFPWLRLRGRSRLGTATQVRLVLGATATLILIGWLWFALAEWNGSLAGLDPGSRVINALFQSITLRTAGFNSVSMQGLQPATLLMMMVWMLVGASPGGTGGGIKTTTAVVLLSVIPAVAQGRSRVELAGRRVPAETVFRSAAIAVAATVLVLGGAALLMATQRSDPGALLFEAVSAFGTVGLSLGATTQLDGLGKVIVVLLMLVGRIGPLSLMLLLGRGPRSRVTYPEARIMVG